MATTRHICIDFEGLGKDRDSGQPKLPHMLGALIPSGPDGKKEYRAFLLREEWAPATRSRRLPRRIRTRKVCTLAQAITELLALANKLDCKLVAFSAHELEMVKTFLEERPDLVEAFEDRSWNIKLDAQKICRKRHGALEEKSLAAISKLLLNPPPAPHPLNGKAAETCRHIDAAAARYRRWRKWPATRRQEVIDLLDYNHADCLAVWRLVNVVDHEQG